MKRRDPEKEFEEKYTAYATMLYKIAFLHLGCKSDAEDVLQDVFTKYLFSTKSFNNAEHEKAWFIRVTQNKCLDILRKSERKALNLEDISPVTEIGAEADHDILNSVLALPEKYKTAVILYYYNCFSVEEIAKTLKISKAAVKKRLQRGREMLKLALEDYAP